ncbi:metalloregulator ArsR/SmtB family transcription factor [Ammoniphilus sp. CFH 90114]|uniref:helix-turn-helix transcriptional regulator n=1 Tax=Ammoniphilus sp. CFH 90114 TaxID=2493665 RepID=UPI00100E9DD9|nr:metalloregulator ArsR/SmtB family transcription factor [Ammoniphilus sp. CFH 90114]RXT05736.1 transcriptional regulator [Ammoniphilus sp. CFH 90114]
MSKAKNSSTRNEILHMLKLHGSLTVSEMAVQLQITEMAVRRHLSTLERDHLIESKMVRQSMGRPTNVYSLSEESEQMFPRHYSDFALDFLQDIEDVEGEEKIRSLFQRREQRLSDKYKKQIKGDTLEKKVKQLAVIQNEKGYMVEIEKDPETGDFIFKEFNCPISQVAKEYNHACDCELSLFKKVLETEVEQNECIAQGEDKCVYVIKNSES